MNEIRMEPPRSIPPNSSGQRLRASDSSMSTKIIFIVGGCLFGALIVPNFTPVHPGMRLSCVNNLRQLEGAKQEWALEFHKSANDVPVGEDLRPFLREMLSCPQGGVYRFGGVGELPSCSIIEHTVQYRRHS